MAEADLSGRKANPRGLRHSFSTGNLLVKNPISEIKKRAGHVRIESTLHYLDLVDDDTRHYAENFWAFATGKALENDKTQE